MKIKINDNFTNILNFIRSSDHYLTYYEVIQWCIDYDEYREYYMNYHVFKDLILEHNKQILEGTWKQVK